MYILLMSACFVIVKYLPLSLTFCVPLAMAGTSARNSSVVKSKYVVRQKLLQLILATERQIRWPVKLNVFESQMVDLLVFSSDGRVADRAVVAQKRRARRNPRTHEIPEIRDKNCIVPIRQTSLPAFKTQPYRQNMANIDDSPIARICFKKIKFLITGSRHSGRENTSGSSRSARAVVRQDRSKHSTFE